MNLLEPLGLIGLAALLPIIALYFLKLKREERVVPSTLLWKKLLDDLQVNSPFQRLKYSLLLLLQLLLAALLAFALARPYLSLAGYAGQKIILLIDTSASMATQDAGIGGKETRLSAALHDAQTKVDDLRSNDELAIIAFDKEVRQLCKFTSDRTRLKQILSSLRPRDMETNAAEAFETAAALGEGHKNVQVLVLSDGCFGTVRTQEQKVAVLGNSEDIAASTCPKPAPLQPGNFRFVSYGSAISDNVAITQIDARTRPVQATDKDGLRIDTLETQVFVMVENFSPTPKEVVLSLSTESQRFPPKVISLKGRAPRDETLAAPEPDGTTVEASRSVEVFKLPAGTTGTVTARIESPKDRLPADDTASVVVGASEGIRLLLVSKGNYF